MREADLRGDAAAAPAFVDDQHAVGPGHARHDGRVVERTEHAQVDDLGLDARCRQVSSRLQCLVQAGAIGEDRHVAALAPDGRATEIDRPRVGRELALHVVERLVLEDQHGIGLPQRGGEHAVAVVDGRGRDDGDAWDMRVPTLEAVRVLCRQLLAAAGRHADDDRHVELPARHVQQGGRRVHDLVEGQQAEVAGHHFDDRPHAAERRADAGADEAGLRERRVTNPFGSELGQQAAADREAAAVAAHVLTHQEHARIGQQRGAQALPHGLAIGDLARLRHDGVGRGHGCAPSEYTKRMRSVTGSSVPASANATASSTSFATSRSIAS